MSSSAANWKWQLRAHLYVGAYEEKSSNDHNRDLFCIHMYIQIIYGAFYAILEDRHIYAHNVYVLEYLDMYTYICIYIHIYIHKCVYLHKCICIRMYLYMYMYVYIYVYIHSFIHIHARDVCDLSQYCPARLDPGIGPSPCSWKECRSSLPGFCVSRFRV